MRARAHFDKLPSCARRRQAMKAQAWNEKLCNTFAAQLNSIATLPVACQWRACRNKFALQFDQSARARRTGEPTAGVGAGVGVVATVALRWRAALAAGGKQMHYVNARRQARVACLRPRACFGGKTRRRRPPSGAPNLSRHCSPISRGVVYHRLRAADKIK